MIYQHLYDDLKAKRQEVKKELYLLDRTLSALAELEDGITSQRLRAEIERYAREEAFRDYS